MRRSSSILWIMDQSCKPMLIDIVCFNQNLRERSKGQAATPEAALGSYLLRNLTACT